MTGTLEILLQKYLVDSSSLANSDTFSSDTISSSFISTGDISVNPALIEYNYNIDYVTYAILLLIGIIAFIWHFMPDRFMSVFTLGKNKKRQTDDTNPIVAGTVITTTLALNFFIISGIFIQIALFRFYPFPFENLSFFTSLLYSYALLFTLITYRTIFIYGVSVVFNTSKIRSQQVIVSRNILFISGVILLPLVLFYLYTQSIAILFVAILILFILQVVRLIKTFIIGNTNSMFSTLHIILYLCALEIVPVLVLVRLFGNSSVL